MRMMTSSASTAQLRKMKKPLIERRRRERINDSLIQLKSLVLEAMNRDESCYSKMEKADILEMTVAHLKSIQRHSVPSSSPETSSFVAMTSSREDAMRKYLLGFNECAREAVKYLSTVEELSDDVGASLMTHVVRYLGSFQSKVKAAVRSSEDGLSSEVVDKTHGRQLTSPEHARFPLLGSTSAALFNGNIIHELNPANYSTISFLSTASDASANCRQCDKNSPKGEEEGKGGGGREGGRGGRTYESTVNAEFRRFNASTFPEDSRFCSSSAASSSSSSSSSSPPPPPPPSSSSSSSSSSDSCQVQNLQVRNYGSENRSQLRDVLNVAKQRQSASSTHFPSPVLTASSAPAANRGSAFDLERTVKREVLLPSSLWRPW